MARPPNPLPAGNTAVGKQRRQIRHKSDTPAAHPTVGAPRRAALEQTESPGAKADDAGSSAPSPLVSSPALQTLPTPLASSSPGTPFRYRPEPTVSLAQEGSDPGHGSTTESEIDLQRFGKLASAPGGTIDLRQERLTLSELAAALVDLQQRDYVAAGSSQGRVLVLTSVGELSEIAPFMHVVANSGLVSGLAIESSLPLINFKWVFQLFAGSKGLATLDVRTGAGKDLPPFIDAMKELASERAGQIFTFEHIKLAVTHAPPRVELVEVIRSIVNNCPRLQTLDLSKLFLTPDAISALRINLNEIGKDGLLLV